jgi:hypothetical protein
METIEFESEVAFVAHAVSLVKPRLDLVVDAFGIAK